MIDFAGGTISSVERSLAARDAAAAGNTMLESLSRAAESHVTAGTER